MSSGTNIPVGQMSQWDKCSSGTNVQWDKIPSGTNVQVGPMSKWEKCPVGKIDNLNKQRKTNKSKIIEKTNKEKRTKVK